jgi:hypothetical protein
MIARTLPLADPRALALKAASRDLIAACGGLERSARVTGLSTSTLSRCQSVEHADLLSLSAVLALETECGHFAVTAALAASHGQSLSERQPVAGGAGMVPAHAATLRASADLMDEVARALTDGRVAPVEAVLIDDDCRALAERVLTLRAACRALMRPAGA